MYYFEQMDLSFVSDKILKELENENLKVTFQEIDLKKNIFEKQSKRVNSRSKMYSLFEQPIRTTNY